MRKVHFSAPILHLPAASPYSKQTTISSASRMLVEIDCIILGYDGDEIKVLLAKDETDVTRNKWSLVGSYLNSGEDLNKGVERILLNLAGLREIYVEQFEVFCQTNKSIPDQKISVVFFSLIKIEGPNDPKHPVRWHSLEKLRLLDFGQEDLVTKALAHLRYQAALHPIGFELLPYLFTIPQIQKLYEAIYNTSLDRRNFSKKILSMGLLLDTGYKGKTGNTNKAKLYKLDTEKYKEKFHLIWNFVPDTVRVSAAS